MICVKPKSVVSSGTHDGHSICEEYGICERKVSNYPPDVIPVNISALSVSFKELHIKVGDKVTWTNKDKQVHTVKSNDGLFNSGNIFPKCNWSYTFTKKGIYTYACTIHSNITGKVIVE